MAIISVDWYAIAVSHRHMLTLSMAELSSAPQMKSISENLPAHICWL